MCNRRDASWWGEVVKARQGHLIGHDSCRAAVMMLPFPAGCKVAVQRATLTRRGGWCGELHSVTKIFVEHKLLISVAGSPTVQCPTGRSL